MTCVMGTVRGMVPREVSSEEFIEHQLHEFDALRQGNHMGPEYEAHFGAASVCSAPKLPRNLRSTSLCWP
jgi:hypothetical protein